MTPLVSIVVPTRNSARTLGLCLESIRLQSYRPVEVIVVDNSSDDGTADVARTFTDKVFVHGPERSAQRNFGLLAIGTGEVFAYIDSDMILGPEVVSSSVDALQQGAVGVYVPEVILCPGYRGAVRRFERQAYSGTPIDAVRFFWSTAFRAVGGFDAELFSQGSGEDWDLDLSLSAQGSFTCLSPAPDGGLLATWPLAEECTRRGATPQFSNAIYHDESSLKWVDYMTKKTYYAVAFGAYQEKWKDDERVAFQFSPINRAFGVFFRAGQWKRTLKRPDLWASAVLWKGFIALVVLFTSRKE